MRVGCGLTCWMVWGSLGIASAFCQSCSPYRHQLQRGRQYYEDNDYERALALWRDLSAHQQSLTPSEQARYAYLRGMTDYRLGFLREARYWLGLAQATEQLRPGGLAPAWQNRLGKALQDLSQEGYSEGVVRGQSAVQAIEAQPVEPVLPASPVNEESVPRELAPPEVAEPNQ